MDEDEADKMRVAMGKAADGFQDKIIAQSLRDERADDAMERRKLNPKYLGDKTVHTAEGIEYVEEER